MKRTAASIVLLAGLGGCVSPDKPAGKGSFGTASRAKEVPGLIGPGGKPVAAAKPTTATAVAKTTTGAKPAGMNSGIVQVQSVDSVPMTDATGGIEPTAGFARVTGSAPVATGGCADGSCGDAGGHALGHRLHNIGHGHHGGGYGSPGYSVSPYGPMINGIDQGMARTGILPAPAMGPWGAVAAVGAGGPGGMPGGPMYPNQRTSIRFVSPQDMRIAWQSAGGGFSDGTPLQAPARYNFPQGSVYRLKLSQIPNRPGLELYPTLEVYPATQRTLTYLSHNAVPVGFTDEDFEQVRAGNLVVKVIYLPFDAFQDQAAVAGADEVVSTRLEPGVDPIVEANRRGTILAVLRVGNIDLEDRNSPGMTAPPGTVAAPTPAVGVPISAAPKTPAPMPMVTTPVAPPAPVGVTPAPLPNAVKPQAPGIPTSLPTK